MTQDVTNEVREITEEESTSIRQSAKDLYDGVQGAYFDLGKNLSEIAVNGLHDRWGYPSFEEYVSEELGCKQRKAWYLVKIYRRAIELGLPREVLEEIGWTKAKEIVDFVESREQFDEWAERAKTVSTGRLIEAIATAKGRSVPKKGKDEDGNKTLENEKGEVFHILEVPLSDSQYDNVKLALEKAKDVAKSDKRGHLIDLISLDFLSTNADVSDMGEKLAEWANRGLIEIDESDD